MDTVVSAFSAIFTVVAILYGLWYTDIASAARTSLPRHEEDRATRRNHIRSVRNSKALPLLLITALMTGVFAPDAVQVVGVAAQILKRESQLEYSSVSAALVLMVIVSIVLVIVLVVDVVRMTSLLRPGVSDSVGDRKTP